LVALVMGVLVLDLGVQGALVANQSRVFALDPTAHNRVNTLYTTAMFVGGALGAIAATRAWIDGGWSAVSVLGILLALLSCVIVLLHRGRCVSDRRET
jgi:predicted MFS family arabinose efflux permease